jgi:undecaprenyl diphosphate synthase
MIHLSEFKYFSNFVDFINSNNLTIIFEHYYNKIFYLGFIILKNYKKKYIINLLKNIYYSLNTIDIIVSNRIYHINNDNNDNFNKKLIHFIDLKNNGNDLGFIIKSILNVYLNYLNNITHSNNIYMIKNIIIIYFKKLFLNINFTINYSNHISIYNNISSKTYLKIFNNIINNNIDLTFINYNYNPKLHIGFILDGNRRFGKKYNLNGHLYGAINSKRIITYIYKTGIIKECTLFVLSYDNYINRSTHEKNNIYKIIEEYLLFIKNNQTLFSNFIINFLGEINLLPENLQNLIYFIIDLNKFKTQNNNIITINYAIVYDGRREIINAVNTYSNNFFNHLLLKNDIDLVIRTGNSNRISGFFPWQTIYSEYYFLDKLWPEFTEIDLDNILNSYNNISINKGK